jgi:hypothetical protein
MKQTVLGWLLLLPLAAWADYTLTMQVKSGAEGGGQSADTPMTEVFKYKDDAHAKMQVTRGGKVVSETYGIGKKTYMVTYGGGKAQIVDYDAMRASMGAYSQYAEPEEDDAWTLPKDARWQKTGKKVKVGDFTGEEWIVSFTDKQGKKERHTVVLSKNKALQKALEAFGRFTLRLSQGEGHKKDAQKMFAPKPGYAVIKADGDFSVTSLSEAAVPDKAFRLPEGEMTVMPSFGADIKGRSGTTARDDGGAGAQEDDKKAASDASQSDDDGINAVNEGVDKAVDALKSLF